MTTKSQEQENEQEQEQDTQGATPSLSLGDLVAQQAALLGPRSPQSQTTPAGWGARAADQAEPPPVAINGPFGAYMPGMLSSMMQSWLPGGSPQLAPQGGMGPWTYSQYWPGNGGGDWGDANPRKDTGVGRELMAGRLGIGDLRQGNMPMSPGSGPTIQGLAGLIRQQGR